MHLLCICIQGGGRGGAVALGCKMVGGGYETTGIRPEHLRDSATTVKQAWKRVEDILLNGEEPWRIRTVRGGARLLVGHGLEHDLDGLGIDHYPAYLKRDTATYPPLMKTSSRQMSRGAEGVPQAGHGARSRRPKRAEGGGGASEGGGGRPAAGSGGGAGGEGRPAAGLGGRRRGNLAA